MADDAKRFRKRAEECRELVPRARDPEIRDMLARVATELDEEADKIEAEKHKP